MDIYYFGRSSCRQPVYLFRARPETETTRTVINSYQLKQLQEEEQANKKADIRAEISQNTKGPRTLRIWNNGRAVARNIRVEGLDVEGLIVMNDEIFPYEIMNPQDDAELKLYLTIGCPQKLTLKLIWDDESGQDNVTTKVITL